ncbi:MAG: DMP19 family protein [Verrucomicrobiota bacterium]
MNDTTPPSPTPDPAKGGDAGQTKPLNALIQAMLEQAQVAAQRMAAYAEREYGPLGSTTDEILSHENDDKKGNVLGALFYRIGLKAESRGESSLTETERRLCAAHGLDGEVNNGGFDQYFFNSTGDAAETALAGLKDMGATAAAALLERAMAVFPGGKPPVDRERRQEEMEKIESRSKPVWDQCDREFYDCKEDISELCLAYARKKRAEIVLP